MSQKAITLRNASYLSDHRYKDTMSKQFCEEWISQGGQRVQLCHWPDIPSLSLVLLGLMLCAVIGWQTSYKIWQSACREHQGYQCA